MAFRAAFAAFMAFAGAFTTFIAFMAGAAAFIAFAMTRRGFKESTGSGQDAVLSKDTIDHT